jgi:hypothetical protein
MVKIRQDSNACQKLQLVYLPPDQRFQNHITIQCPVVFLRLTTNINSNFPPQNAEFTRPLR